ncbi:MAG: 2-phosphosulfolactate phosphatase [bacterium]
MTGGGCHLFWGSSGAQLAAETVEAIVIVDTLSFSTTVITAVSRGAVVYPCGEGEDSSELARQVGGVASVHRDEVPQRGLYSLSPLTFRRVPSGTKVVLNAVNGGTCSRLVKKAPFLLVGALINAEAAAAAVSEVLDAGRSCAVVVCGERLMEAGSGGGIRFAVEDYLGAGAILSYLECEKSAEARVCQAAFAGVREELLPILKECDSGQELCEMGFAGDVDFAAQLNSSDTVPIFRDGCYVKL